MGSRDLTDYLVHAGLDVPHRMGWDSNPRYGFAAHTLSRGAGTPESPALERLFRAERDDLPTIAPL